LYCADVGKTFKKKQYPSIASSTRSTAGGCCAGTGRPKTKQHWQPGWLCRQTLTWQTTDTPDRRTRISHCHSNAVEARAGHGPGAKLLKAGETEQLRLELRKCTLDPDRRRLSPLRVRVVTAWRPRPTHCRHPYRSVLMPAGRDRRSRILWAAAITFQKILLIQQEATRRENSRRQKHPGSTIKGTQKNQMDPHLGKRSCQQHFAV
jgi:hypothetical protein